MNQSSQRRLWYFVLAVSIVLLLLLGGFLFWGYYGGNRIDVARLTRKDHPVFQGPHRPDGTIDYLSNLTKHASRDVTTRNNVAVALLTAVPDDFYPHDQNRKQSFASLLEIETPVRTPIPSIAKVARNLGSPVANQPSLAQLQQTYINLLGKPVDSGHELTDSEIEIAKLFLTECSLGIDAFALKLPHCTQCYYPPTAIVPLDDLWMDVASPVVEGLYVQPLLTMRANLRLSQGQLPEAWEDIRSLFLLGNAIARHCGTAEYTYGRSIRTLAIRQTLNLLNHPGLDHELLVTIEADLETLVTSETYVRQMDFHGRLTVARFLDEVFATGQCHLLATKIRHDQFSRIARMPGWIDSTWVMNLLNELIDDLIVELQSKNLTQSLLRTRQILSRFRAETEPATTMLYSPKKEASKATARYLASVISIENAMEFHCDAIGWERLLWTGIAIKRFEFTSQRLPTSASELTVIDPNILLDPFTGRAWKWENCKGKVILTGHGRDGIKEQRSTSPNASDDHRLVVPAHGPL